MESIFSNFDRLRLPLIIMVVFIHAQFSINMGNEITSYDVISYLFTTVISSAAVPFFFIISGCLYFRDYKEFSKKLYIKKQKRRVRTLVIPFLTWNFIFWLFFTVFAFLVPSLIKGGIPSLIGASYKDFVFVFWGSTGGGPIDFPLWFIRDLLLVSFISPLLYALLFKFQYGFFTVLLLGAMWFIDMPIVIMGNDIKTALFFFVLGGYINKVQYNDQFVNRYNMIKYVWGFLAATWLIICVFSCIYHFIYDDTFYVLLLSKIGVLTGILAIYCLVDRNRAFFEMTRTYIPSDCVFFVFASHGFLITFIKRVVERMSLNNEFLLIVFYFGSVLLTICICVCMYWIIKRYAPQLFALLTGRMLLKV